MTIWIESPFDSLPTEGYRKQRYWMMAEAFVRAGHRVVYWTSDFSHATKRRREVKVRGEGERRNFNLVFIPTRPYPGNVCWQRIASHRAYARTWERMAVEAVSAGGPRPDVIIVSSPPLSTGAVGRRLARRFGAKFVVDVQDAWPETFYRLLPGGFRWLGGLLLSGMRKAADEAYRAADLVTGVCDRYERLVRERGARDYYRAYLGIEAAGPRPKDGGRRSHEGVIRLAYVGNLGVSYDLKTVIRGVELLNGRGAAKVTLDVAGFGGTVDASASVRFHGMLDETSLRVLLSRCDIGIIPMREDSYVGIPNKLAEYAAAGLGVVSSLRGETADLIAQYACGATYRAGDAESFADAVEAAHRLPENAGGRLLSEELAAERIYDAYCERVCTL